jgi:nucleoside-diphosphate-sugar epimerase
VARILIVGGGCRGRRLASAMTADGLGHAVRITTRSEDGRAAIEEVGAECWVGTPARLATLRGALENVTVVCWLLGTATGTVDELAALHSTRLEFFLGQAIDTTMRGFVYETTTRGDAAGGRPIDDSAGGRLPSEAIAAGERIVRTACERNAIPGAFLTADPASADAWLARARTLVESLLGHPPADGLPEAFGRPLS